VTVGRLLEPDQQLRGQPSIRATLDPGYATPRVGGLLNSEN
jgi:hypothetical protein